MSVGLDKHIDDAINKFNDNLWTTYDNLFVGRSFNIPNKQNQKSPHYYLGSNEYKEIFVDDNYDSIIHFHVGNPRPNTATSTYVADVYIMVAVNLGKIYGTDTRAAEQAHRAVDRVLRKTRFNKISNLVTDIEAYDIYDLTDKQTALFDMQPYYVFRFESSIMYSADNLCDDTEITQTVTVNLSSTTGGTATSSLGGENDSPFTVDKNTNAAFYAIADSGYRFRYWLLNGIQNLINPLPLIITKAYNIVAEFIAQYTLTTSVSGNGTISPSGAKVYDDGTVVDLTVTPDPENEIDRVEEDGTPISAPYQVTMDADKGVIAYFRALANLVFNGFSNLVVSNEIVNSVGDNATVVAGGVKSVTNFANGISLLSSIPYDWATDGVKFEFIYKQDSSVANFPIGEDDGEGSIRIFDTGCTVYFPISISPFYQAEFVSISLPKDTYRLIKFETISNIVNISFTTPDDPTYASATVKTIDLATVPNLINTTNWLTFLTGRASTGFKGEFLYAKVGTHEFNFDVINFNQYEWNFDRVAVWSSTTNNRALINTTNLEDCSQTEHISSSDGYTLTYQEAAPLETIIGISPYNSGVTNLPNIVGNLAVTEYYEEYENNELLIPYGIKMPASILAYDVDNVLFDVGNNPNKLTAQTLPDQYNKSIFFDRAINEISIYDTSKPSKLTAINLVNKEYFACGDSLAALRYPDYLQFKLGCNKTILNKSGNTFSQMATAYEADLVADPTIFDSAKLITIIGGANDYGQGYTQAQCQQGVDDIVTLFLANIPADCKIIMCGIYNSVGAVTDPDTPNAGGLTFNIIRSIVSAKADNSTIYYCDWSQAGIVSTDFTGGDTTHAYSASGGAKLTNQIIDTIQTILE